jgi:hypothetical protein
MGWIWVRVVVVVLMALISPGMLRVDNGHAPGRRVTALVPDHRNGRQVEHLVRRGAVARWVVRDAGPDTGWPGRPDR